MIDMSTYPSIIKGYNSIDFPFLDIFFDSLSDKVCIPPNFRIILKTSILNQAIEGVYL